MQNGPICFEENTQIVCADLQLFLAECSHSLILPKHQQTNPFYRMSQGTTNDYPDAKQRIYSILEEKEHPVVAWTTK